MPQDKINAYMTLYTALVTVSKAAAPMIPFMTEDIYQNIVKNVDATAPEVFIYVTSLKLMKLSLIKN